VSSRVSLGELVVGAVVLALLFVAVHGCGPHAQSPWRASWTRTPGVVNPDVTQATIRDTICVRGWTRTIRPPVSYTNELKLRQLREYPFPGGARQYQEDHLISLELGGDPQDPRNLWPERRPRAEQVDAIENELNAKICSGEISLRDGQRRISEIKHTDG
jgi:hypothetical protein